jgi:hypothetical protein
LGAQPAASVKAETGMVNVKDMQFGALGDGVARPASINDRYDAVIADPAVLGFTTAGTNQLTLIETGRILGVVPGVDFLSSLTGKMITGQSSAAIGQVDLVYGGPPARLLVRGITGTFVNPETVRRMDTGATATLNQTIDASETNDWLGIQLAVNTVAQAGGGVVDVPNGVYKIKRHINLPSNVTLRGETRSGAVLDNVWNAGTGYYADFRPAVIAAGCFHPDAIADGDPNAMTRLTVAGTVEAGSNIVALTVAPTGFVVGDFAVLHSTATDPVGPNALPRAMQINQVIRVDTSTNRLFFAKPFKRQYASSYVSRFGTGRDVLSGFGDTPWLCVRDVVVTSLTARSTGRLIGRNAAWNLRIEDVDHDGGAGIVHNAFVYSTLRRMRITTKECGIESKIGTFATTFEDIDVIFSSTIKTGRMPLVACGESSEDITYRRVNVYDGPNFGQDPGDTTAQVARIRIGAYDTHLEDCTVVCSIAGSTAINVTTEHGGERTTAARLRLVAPTGGPTSLLLVNAKNLGMDVFQASPTIGIDGLACFAPSGTIPVKLDKLAGDSWVRDLVGAPIDGDDAGKLRQLVGRASPDLQLSRPDGVTLGLPSGVAFSLPATSARPLLLGQVRVWRDGNQNLRLKPNVNPINADDGDAFAGGLAATYVGTGNPAPPIDMQGLTAIRIDSPSAATAVFAIENAPLNRPFTLVFLNGNVTVKDGTLRLNGDFEGSTNATLTLIRVVANIYELARSTN